MDIAKYIKESHEYFVSAGEYRCPECCGNGFYHPITNGDGDSDGEEVTCHICNGKKIDPNKNIDEMLIRIVGELCKAEEAHRCGRFACESCLVNILDYPEKHHKEEAIYLFERGVKDTYEDHIAMALIRLFDLCGYFNLHIPNGINDESGMIREYMGKENIGECLCMITKQITDRQIIFSLMLLMSFCRQKNIPIQKHIEAKMAYNKTRPAKHGKNY